MSGSGTDPARIAAGDRTRSHSNSRLQAARDHHAICSSELFGRENSLPDGEAPHACRVVALPETDREGDAAGAGTAPDRRQLCDTQTPEGAALAETPSPRDGALHTDGKLWDESSRALFGCSAILLPT